MLLMVAIWDANSDPNGATAVGAEAEAKVGDGAGADGAGDGGAETYGDTGESSGIVIAVCCAGAGDGAVASGLPCHDCCGLLA